MANRRELSQAVKSAGEVATRNELLFGPDHPESLEAGVTYARACYAAHDFASARSTLERVLAIRIGQLGTDDYEVLRLKNLLGLVLRDAGEFGSASAVEREVLQVCEAKFGEDDQFTIVAMINLAATLASARSFDGLIELDERIIERQLRIHGENHIETLQAMARCARDRFAMGDPKGAQGIDRVLLERAIAIPMDLRGILDAKRRLLIDAAALGEWEAAFRLWDEVMADADKLPFRDDLRSQLTCQRKYIGKLRLQCERQIARGNSPDPAELGFQIREAIGELTS